MDANTTVEGLSNRFIGWKGFSTAATKTREAGCASHAISLMARRDLNKVHPELANFHLAGIDVRSKTTLKKVLGLPGMNR
ncbi:hypothetical protein BH10ACI4_BH10ACI4_04830 [soil metagenome]